MNISRTYSTEIHYNYIYGATGLAAICVRRNGIDSMYYVHPDRLGSYIHITNANKQVIRNLHFDPWGNVKSDADWTAFDTTTLSGNLAGTFRFDRGFTGHEHYADLKIINMKAPSKREQKQACLIFVKREVLRDEVSTYGRLYDPVIARFFSPDNFVQAPSFTQSYNRYSYCLNNSLQYTVKRMPMSYRHKFTMDFSAKPDDAIAEYHIHWQKPGVMWCGSTDKAIKAQWLAENTDLGETAVCENSFITQADHSPLDWNTGGLPSFVISRNNMYYYDGSSNHTSIPFNPYLIRFFYFLGISW